MKGFTFKKGRVGDSLFAHSFFKSFIVFAVMMIMTMSSASAEVIDGLCYDLNSDTKTATLIPRIDNEKYSGDIIIPEKVKGNDGEEYVVTTFADNCFEDCRGLTSITIPSSVMSLGKKCFFNCSGLTSITIPSSVTSLGKYCFADCRGLTSITIPSSVTSLDDLCFLGCSGLTSITIPSSVTSLGKYCFSNCNSLTSITIPSSVTSLDDYCFEGCSSLTSITIPSSVTSLVDGCFSGCSSLTSIDIPSSVTSLDYYCFAYCSGLTTIKIPSSVTYMGNECFSGCKALKTVYFEGKVPRIDSSGTGISYTSNIKVPAEYLKDYKKALGSDYLYISAWNPNELDDDDKPVAPCATPTISYESGELKFACETAGAKYHYTISSIDMTTNAISDDGKVSLSATYHISVYATADNHTASLKAEATLYWINANLETTNINPTKTRGIVASAHDGIVSISGLYNGEVVKFYSVDGKLLGSSSAVDGVASCAVSESMIIAKIGMDTIKVLIK